jgi:hypothetical protein
MVLLIGTNRCANPSCLGRWFRMMGEGMMANNGERYYESQAWLLQGKFPASRGSVFLLTLVACAVSTPIDLGQVSSADWGS